MTMPYYNLAALDRKHLTLVKKRIKARAWAARLSVQIRIVEQQRRSAMRSSERRKARAEAMKREEEREEDPDDEEEEGSEAGEGEEAAACKTCLRQ